MQLAEYVDAGHGRQSAIALVIECQPQLVWQWSRGVRAVPQERCPAIERATEGNVTADELRPDIRWARVPDPNWPHPDGRPTIDVAAPELVGADDGSHEPAKA